MSVIKNAIQIGKIVTLVAALFNLNSFQTRELNNYAKLRQYEWIEKRKDDAEVEAQLRSEAQRISGK